MKITKLSFDEDHEMLISIPEEPDVVTLAISDDLDAAYEPINNAFGNKIIDFINKSNVWYSKAQDRISDEFSKSVESRLLSIHILSEDYDNDIIFGLLYRLEEDIEHGRGIKISGNNLEIIDYGIGDVALF